MHSAASSSPTVNNETSITEVYDTYYTTTTSTTTIILQLFWILSGTTRVSWYQKGKTRKLKPIWIYLSKRQWVAVTSVGPYANLSPNQQHQSTEGYIWYISSLLLLQPFYDSLDFVWDNPGEPVPEETSSHWLKSTRISCSIITKQTRRRRQSQDNHRCWDVFQQVWLIVNHQDVWLACFIMLFHLTQT